MKTRCRLAAALQLAVFLTGLVSAQGPCTESDIVPPRTPEMLEVDLLLLQGLPNQKQLPEWSKVEKLRAFYQSYAIRKATCSVVEGRDVALRLFVLASGFGGSGYDQPAGLLDPDKAFQFYGVSRLKVERVEKDVTRVFALPIAGPVTVGEVVDSSELQTLLEDLAQVQMVPIPRVQRWRGADGVAVDDDCFRISHVTAVPTRVFEDLEVPAGDASRRLLTLDARRRALEYMARQVEWLKRMETEQPTCGTVDLAGYRGRQITSLDLTVRELIPDVEFVSLAVEFWNDVERRVEELRNEEESWRKALRSKDPGQ